ncbi:MAG TPA: CoA ester lyase [Actinomycetota bacterium]
MSARSFLYVPGHREDALAKAASRGADALILDLEDAVPVAAKMAARAAVAAWLRARPEGVEAWVRINAGEAGREDLAAIGAACDGVSVPKVSSPGDIPATGLPVIALIETAAGVLDARSIASHPRVVRLAVGEADLSAELGVEASPDGNELWTARKLVVLASAAAGVEQPIGPVSTDFRDLDALRASTEALKRTGFGARAAIHPAQVPAINEVFTPGAAEVERARALIARYEQAGGGATVDDDGRMIDEAVVRSARRVIERARP